MVLIQTVHFRCVSAFYVYTAECKQVVSALQNFRFNLMEVVLNCSVSSFKEPFANICYYELDFNLNAIKVNKNLKNRLDAAS